VREKKPLPNKRQIGDINEKMGENICEKLREREWRGKLLRR
jgi:hypothetical protein